MLEAFGQIREIHAVFEEADGILAADIQNPTCIPNCGRCCMCNVPNAMTIEAIYAVSVLTGTVRLKKMVSIAEGWLLERHPFATVYEGMPVGFTSPKIKDEWLAVTRSQCPFLDARNKSCLLHDCRPLACRAYGVTRDAADVCPRPLGRGESETQRRYIPADKLREFIDECRKEWEKKNKAWLVAGNFPATLYRAAEPKKFKKYILDNKIASAKIIGIEYETALMWQPQVAAIRAGMSPDMAALMR